MSYVLATPEMVAAAANNLAQIGSTLSAANAAALAPTTGVLAAGADEVSAAVASLFSGHAQAYQTLGTQAAAFHERFIQALSTAAGAYGSAEAANASPLQQALNVINAPTQTLLGRPLIGNGTNGAPGTGQAGGPGGLLWGPASGANYVDPLGLLKSTPIRLKPLSSEGRTLHYRQAEPVFVNEAAAGALAGAGHRKSPKQGVFRGAAQGGDIVARQPPGRWVCPSSAGGPIGWHRQ